MYPQEHNQHRCQTVVEVWHCFDSTFISCVYIQSSCHAFHLEYFNMNISPHSSSISMAWNNIKHFVWGTSTYNPWTLFFGWIFLENGGMFLENNIKLRSSSKDQNQYRYLSKTTFILLNAYVNNISSL